MRRLIYTTANEGATGYIQSLLRNKSFDVNI